MNIEESSSFFRSFSIRAFARRRPTVGKGQTSWPGCTIPLHFVLLATAEEPIVLAGLTENVKVLAFYKEADQDGQLASLLKEYAAQNHRFTCRFVDPDREPSIAQSYGVNRYQTITMEGRDRRLRVFEPTEGSLTNTLARLIQRKPVSVCFLTGHGEHDIDSLDRQGFQQARKALDEANYESKAMELGQEMGVPDDCAVTVIAGANQNPSAVELEKIRAYLDHGGSLLLLPAIPAAAGMRVLFRRLR